MRVGYHPKGDLSWRAIALTNAALYAEPAGAIGDDPIRFAEARRNVNTRRATVLVCGGLIAILGASVLVGWLFGIEPLVTVLPGFARMRANTALGFIALGIGLAETQLALGNLPGRGPARRFAACMVWLAMAIGAATLVEYLFGIDFHIDQLLFHDARSKVYPGRMAAISAACFCLGSASLLLQRGGRAAQKFASAPALLLALAASSGIVGYLYGVPILYGSNTNASMALHTGLGFLVLGAGLVLSQPESGLARALTEDAIGSSLARHLLAAVMLAPVILGWIYLQPAINFGQTRFAVALLAMTLTVTSAAALWFLAKFLNREESRRAEFSRRQEESNMLVLQSERELRMVTDRLPILLAYIDAAGRFKRVNRTYEQWLGKDSMQIVGKTVRELLGEDYWWRTAHARDAARRGQTTTFETAYPTRQGERQAQITYLPDIDEDEHVRGIVSMVLDVDEYRRTESALRQSEKLAIVGRMASSIAHEINNPLEAITNLLYLIRSSEGMPAEVNDYVTSAQEQLKRVSNIVIETLRFHRQASHPIRARLSDIVEQVLFLHQGRLSQASIEVERRFRGETLLLCRDGEIRQVLANLVSNAADAMNRGGRLLVRTHDATAPASGQRGIVITIADTGCGIGDKIRQKLFQPFHTTKGETGSGLGLWISKEIIDRHQGSLRVRSLAAEQSMAGTTSTRRTSGASSRGSGTVFRIFLPHAVTEK